MSIRDQIRSMLRVEPRERGFRAMFEVRPDLAILPDHFADAQILPGMCMVQAVLLAGAMSQGVPDLRLRVLKNAKMTQPVLPGDSIVIDGDVTITESGDIAIKAKLSGDNRKRAEISLIAHSVKVAEGASE